MYNNDKSMFRKTNSKAKISLTINLNSVIQYSRIKLLKGIILLVIRLLTLIIQIKCRLFLVVEDTVFTQPTFFVANFDPT